MSGIAGIGTEPRTAVVVGAGIVGLSTAWFLQERGIEVTVVDRSGVAAGSSWGNAGYLSPALAIPLNEPSVLRYGLRSLLDPDAPLHVPATVNPGLWRFLLRFAAHCHWHGWKEAAHTNLPLNTAGLRAFDTLTAGGVQAPTISAPVTALFTSSRQATGLLQELRRLTEMGQEVAYHGLPAEQLREQVPQAGEDIGAGVRLEGQRYVDPGGFVASLADSVRQRGGVIKEGIEITSLRSDDTGVTVLPSMGSDITADVAVIATGAWLDRLSQIGAVRVPVRAGRGYSFTVPTDEPVPGPLYLPEVRVACTPYHGGLRVGGTMEFRGPDSSLEPRRIEAIIKSARPFLRGVRWEERHDDWVGSRPVTPDGKPLVGPTAIPGAYVAGGHGMWGFTQGPITGQLLAEQISTGNRPEALRQTDPLR